MTNTGSSTALRGFDLNSLAVRLREVVLDEVVVHLLNERSLSSSFIWVYDRSLARELIIDIDSGTFRVYDYETSQNLTLTGIPFYLSRNDWLKDIWLVGSKVEL